MKPPLLVIAGPTGVGKTATAVALARLVGLEVVSADSRQVYRGMDAATGKPSPEELAAVRHHLIDVAEPDDPYHAARFRRDAAALVAAIHGRGRLPVVVGGTGLYIRALLRGLDPAPPADPEFRRALETVAVHEGREALHRRLVQEAPEVARRLHPRDHVRVVRALERVRAGERGLPAAGTWQTADEEYRVLSIGLTADRAVLWPRLRARARAMADAGLLDEVQALLRRGHDPSLPALRGIGYREFIQVAHGRRTREDAIQAMARATVDYARRQHTWFRREPELRWVDVEAVGGPAAVAAALMRMLEKEGFTE